MGRTEWLPIADLPDHLRDGRYVLLWSRSRPIVAYWDAFDDAHAWATDNGDRVDPTMFAELNAPNGGPILEPPHPAND